MVTALLLVDHGSRRAASNEMLGCVAGLVQELVGPAVVVRFAHMEIAPPTVAEGVDACVAAGATEVVVVPYMLSRGRHATEDIPALAAEAAARHPGLSVRVTEPLGVHRLIARVVLERAGLPEAAGADPSACSGDPSTCAAPYCAASAPSAGAGVGAASPDDASDA